MLYLPVVLRAKDINSTLTVISYYNTVYYHHHIAVIHTVKKEVKNTLPLLRRKLILKINISLFLLLIFNPRTINFINEKE